MRRGRESGLCGFPFLGEFRLRIDFQYLLLQDGARFRVLRLGQPLAKEFQLYSALAPAPQFPIPFQFRHLRLQ